MAQLVHQLGPVAGKPADCKLRELLAGRGCGSLLDPQEAVEPGEAERSETRLTLTAP